MSKGWKSEVEDYQRLSIKGLGAFNCYSACNVYWGEGENRPSIQVISDPEEKQITLDYKYRNHGEDWIPTRYAVRLSQSPCHFGGYRWFFLCPRCNKRVAHLYHVGSMFTCRHCNNLTYQSRNKTRGSVYLYSRFFDYEDKADRLYQGKRSQTHYNNQPTRRYRLYTWYKEISELYAIKVLSQRKH